MTNNLETNLNYYLNLDYPMSVRPLAEEDGGGWLVEFPDLKGCIGTGDTTVEAIEDAIAAKEAWLEVALENGKKIPEPNNMNKYSGNFALRMPKSLHQWVAENSEKEGVSINQFINHVLSQAKGKKTF